LASKASEDRQQLDEPMLSTHEFETTRDRTGKREPEAADNDDKMLNVRDEEDEIMDATLIP